MMDDQIDDEMTARFCLALGPLYPSGGAQGVAFREGPGMIRFVLRDYRGPEGSCGYTLHQHYASRVAIEQCAFGLVESIACDMKDRIDRSLIGVEMQK